MDNDRPGPVIDLHQIKRIETYEIMRSDLEEYCEATKRSETAFGFLTGCGGAFISCAAASAGVSGGNPTVVATFVSVTVVLAIATLFFGVVWWRERRKIPPLLDKVRERATD